MTSADASSLPSSRQPYSQAPKKFIDYLHRRSKSLSQISPGLSSDQNHGKKVSGASTDVTRTSSICGLQSVIVNTRNHSGRPWMSKQSSSITTSTSEKDPSQINKPQVEDVLRRASIQISNSRSIPRFLTKNNNVVLNSTTAGNQARSGLELTDLLVLAEQRHSIMQKAQKPASTNLDATSGLGLNKLNFLTHRLGVSRPAFSKPPLPRGQLPLSRLVPRRAVTDEIRPTHSRNKQHETGTETDLVTEAAKPAELVFAETQVPHSTKTRDPSGIGNIFFPADEFQSSSNSSSEEPKKNFIVQYKSKQVPSSEYHPNTTLEDASRPSVLEQQPLKIRSRQASICQQSPSQTLKDLLTCELDNKRLTISMEDFRARMASKCGSGTVTLSQGEQNCPQSPNMMTSEYSVKSI